MRLVSTVCTFLLFSHVPLCRGNFNDLMLPVLNNCSTCRRVDPNDFEPLKRVAIIKAEILRRIGIHQPPAVSPSPPRIPISLPVPVVSSKQTDYEYELSDILSYSEAPDNFTDKNIVQFKLAEGNTERQLRVKSANLLIRVKCAKDKSKSKDNDKNKTRRKRRPKMVDLVISTVNAKGRSGDVIASVKTKLKKTKWLKLNLPEELVQQAIDSQNKTLQLYVQCVGCGKRAKVILVHKRRKRRRANNKTTSYKLHKRRPILFLHTSVTTGRRVRRNARVRQCDANSGSNCCKSNFVVDFESQEFGWENWIISPRRYRTAFCEGVCRYDNSTASANGTRECVPVRTRPLRLVYYNGEGAILQGVLPNMIVTKCGCRRDS